jgi:hypothetical protein
MSSAEKNYQIVKKHEKIIDEKTLHKVRVQFNSINTQLRLNRPLFGDKVFQDKIKSKINTLIKTMNESQYDTLVEKLQPEIRVLRLLGVHHVVLRPVLEPFLRQVIVAKNHEHEVIAENRDTAEFKELTQFRQSVSFIKSLRKPETLYQNKAGEVSFGRFCNELLFNPNDLKYLIRDKKRVNKLEISDTVQDNENIRGEFSETFVLDYLMKKKRIIAKNEIISCIVAPKGSKADHNKIDLFIATAIDTVENKETFIEIIDYIKILSNSAINHDSSLLLTTLSIPEAFKEDEFFNIIIVELKEKVEIFHKILEEIVNKNSHSIPDILVDQAYGVLNLMEKIMRIVYQKLAINFPQITMRTLQIKSSPQGLIEHAKSDSAIGVLFIPVEIFYLQQVNNNTKPESKKTLNHFNELLNRSLQKLLA